jgi:hypothetical protein
MFRRGAKTHLLFFSRVLNVGSRAVRGPERDFPADSSDPWWQEAGLFSYNES